MGMNVKLVLEIKTFNDLHMFIMLDFTQKYIKYMTFTANTSNTNFAQIEIEHMNSGIK